MFCFILVADTFTKEDLQMVERGRVELTLELAQIGVSLIDASPQELCFVSIDGVVLNYTDSVFEQTIEVRVRDVQVCCLRVCVLKQTSFSILFLSILFKHNERRTIK